MADLVAELRASAMPGTHVGDCMTRAADEIERLRLWVVAIGSLPDLDADNRSWMAAHALNGRRPPDRATQKEAD